MTAPTDVSWIKPEFRDFVTPKQWEAIELIREHGSQQAAARAAGLAPNAINERFGSALKRLAAKGYAPGHWSGGTAPGYIMGKVTVHRDYRTGEPKLIQAWEREHPELTELLARLREAVDAMKDEIPKVRKIAAPRHMAEDLCTQYTITDYHFGMQAHASEGDEVGADWNLEIAEDMLVAAILHLSSKAPPSCLAVLALLGDLLHFDGPDAVTPTNRHPLDAAGRQKTMVRVVIRAIRRVVQILLAKHARVKIVVMEGNHDISGTPWLQELLTALYENEPRVEVSQNDLPFYAMSFGVNFLGFHHGHKRQKQKLPGLFASMFRELWGKTRKGYIHTGHYHEADEKEYPGTLVIQHRTFAAPDSHSLRGGWLSEREMAAIHYHARFGQAGRDFVTPEMLDLGLAQAA